MRLVKLILALLLPILVLPILHGCGNDPLPNDCGGVCEPFGSLYPEVGTCKDGACSPTFGECFEKGEFETCDQACTAAGSTCVENGCAGYTSIVIGSLEWCQDPDKEGTARPHTCDAPIDWQFTSAGRCCCEQE
jgi:hypothetical protein